MPHNGDESNSLARVRAGWDRCSLRMPRSWLNPAATSSASNVVSGVESLPTHRRSWVATPHEPQAHVSPVSTETRTRGWLAAFPRNDTRSRIWQLPEACAQATTNRSLAGKRVPAWTEPSAVAEPQAEHHRSSGSRSWLEPSAILEPQAKRQRSSGCRSWLEPSATAEPQVKRQRMPDASVQCPESSVRHLHLDLLSLMLATDEAGHLTKYARDGMDSARVKRVMKKPCECTGDSRCCARQLPEAGVVEYCQRFHHLSQECQTHLIATSYETCGPVPADRAARTQWHLLGVPVCVSALAAILGVTPRTLYKRVHQAVDLRKTPWSALPHEAPQQRIVNQFFAELYMSAAEHLAEQDLDIGKVDDNIAQDAALPEGAQVQCPEGLPDIPWNPDQCFSTHSLMAAGHDLRSFPVRYLQHGRLIDLWWQFLAWWHSLAHVAPGEQVQRPSWATFWRAWHAKWQCVLAFRKSSSHACCTQCFKYMQYLHKGQASLAAKQEAARNWRAHLREQYHDRLLYWQLRWFSRQYRRQSPESSGASVLTIIIDSMDKSKLVWPQYAFQQPKSLAGLARPRMVLTAAIAHGWTVEFFLTDEEVTSHGASHFCDVLTKTLERVQEIADREGREMPKHLCIQSDNTTSQAKNSLVGQYLAHLVGAGHFETCTLNFLPVGHTHEDIDLVFGILLANVLRRYRVQCPEELCTMIEIGMAEWAAKYGLECHCAVRHMILDFKGWLDHQGVHLHNCWVTRNDVQAPHSFAYKRRHGLTDAEFAATPGQSEQEDPCDVFCIVKHRMHSLHPNSAPVLVLPRARLVRMPSTSPRQWEVPSPMSSARIRDLRNLADTLENTTEDWGPAFSYFRAAMALRQLVQSRAGGVDPPPASWLDFAGCLAQPAVRDTGNVYFGHLPNMSWRMLATFRQ